MSPRKRATAALLSPPSSRRVAAWTVGLLLLCIAPNQATAASGSGVAGKITPTKSAEAGPSVDAIAPASPAASAPFVHLQLAGWSRLRGQWLSNPGLGQGGMPGSVSRIAGSAPGGDVGLADARLRLNPTLFIGALAEIHAQIDVSGGLLSGATPAVGSGPLVGLMGGSAWSDLVLVRRAWGTFDLFGLAKLTIGRVGDHFGLGLWRNDGRDRLSDFQSDVDRVGLTAKLFGLKFGLSRDTMGTLPITSKGPEDSALRYGLQDSADVIRYLAQVEGGAPSPTSDGLRWGVAVSYQDQSVALRMEHEDNPDLDAACLSTGNCSQLVPRDALLIVPQGTVSWRTTTKAGVFHAEGEALLRVATVDNTDALPSTDTSTTFVGGAIATRLSLTTGTHRFGLRAGWASGDDAGGFGVLDQANLTVLDPNSKELVHRSFVTGVAAHRGMLVDGLLFREVIGAVANAWYARPSWRLSLGSTSLGRALEIGCLIAGASQSGATPGKASFLGIEPAGRVDWGFGTAGRGVLQFSYFAPGPAFDAGRDGASATAAWRLSAAWIVEF
ncbi:MAG: hypothetical protein KC502_02945 [Myxococcales bacterium]|nr:hypothetical protein [Myxococcales bacterium]